jgi:septum site-determining protein MinD
MGKVYLIASGKGGTGKTMFSVNLGATFALHGLSVVILDMDMGMRNVDLYCGLENNVVYDAYDVMTGLCKIKQALVRDSRFENLYIMGATPMRDDGTITPLHCKVLCEKLKEMFDIVIIDAPSGIDDGLVTASGGADAAVIVTTPEYAALRNADSVDRELLQLGIRERYVVVNRVIAELMRQGYTPKLEEITQMMRPELIGVIQSDRNINISTNLGVPIVLKPDTYIRKNFELIARRLLENIPAEPARADEMQDFQK